MKPETVRYSRGPFAQITAVRVLCSDNRERWARVGIPESHFSAPARVSVSGSTVSGWVSFGEERSTFHTTKRGRNSHKLPGDHAPEQYWRAAWKAHCEKGLARIYCGPVDAPNCRGTRSAEAEGHSMMEFVRPHALANLAFRNLCTLAKINAKRYGWNLVECEERRRTPRPVCDVAP